MRKSARLRMIHGTYWSLAEFLTVQVVKHRSQVSVTSRISAAVTRFERHPINQSQREVEVWNHSFWKESSAVDTDAHGGPAWQHVLALWFLTYTHAFDRIPHPRLSNAVLDYYSRIWIYLRQAPIKLQIGRSMRPSQTPFPPFFWGFVGEMLLSVAGSVSG